MMMMMITIIMIIIIIIIIIIRGSGGLTEHTFHRLPEPRQRIKLTAHLTNQRSREMT